MSDSDRGGFDQRPRHHRHGRLCAERFLPVVVALVVAFAGGGPLASEPNADHPAGPAPKNSGTAHKSDDLGVEVVALRETIAGHMLDFRVRCIDPDKAGALLKRGSQAMVSLLHDASGKSVMIAHSQVGTMRTTTLAPERGRVYPMLFENPGIAKAGDTMTLVVGDKRLTGITVEAE